MMTSSTLRGVSVIFPVNFNKDSVTPIYKTVTSLVFFPSTLRYPLGMEKLFHTRTYLKILGIVGKLLNEVYHLERLFFVNEFSTDMGLYCSFGR